MDNVGSTSANPDGRSFNNIILAVILSSAAYYGE